jgi:rhodanese-related sulfurtransferase
MTLKLPAELIGEKRQQVRELDVLAAADLPAGAVLIDIREPESYAQGRLPGAANLPRGLLEFTIIRHPGLASGPSPSSVDTAAPIYLYCDTGGRSVLAACALQEMGFEEVYSLAGGFKAWQSSGYPIEND